MPRRTKLLSSTRPGSRVSASTSTTSSAGRAANLSSKATRSVIGTHHTLQKQLSQAIAADDAEKVRELEARLEEHGGLKLYQKASTIGQGRERGGDTSGVLVGWLREGGVIPPPRASRKVNGESGGRDEAEEKGGKLRVLEVGALSTENSLNIEGVTKVRRIDLHSQHPEIEEVDFMALDPGEQWEGQKRYDVLSLSLVVNFVGDSRARGEMLRHTIKFLRHGTDDEDSKERDGIAGEMLLPALFLVLPLPCVDNSRYLTEERLTAIMESLGYVKTRVKRTGKLYYSLWRLQQPAAVDDHDRRETNDTSGMRKAFKKEELRKGKDRNNFCIVLDDAG